VRKASFVVLAFLGVAMLLISFASANLAYNGDYPIGAPPVMVGDVAQGRPGLEAALRGIRGTSAAFAAAFAVLWLAVVFGPYKRGEVWAWWALAASVVALAVIVLLRIPTLDTRMGMPTALVILGISALGLLLDVRRLSATTA
jgi:hypothetical protein